MTIYELFKSTLVEPLKTITIANGYDNDVTALEGWLTQYSDDLEAGVNGKSFPVVVVRPSNESCNVKPARAGGDNHIDNAGSRTYHVLGAISLMADPETYVERLESLLLDVKRSLSDTRHVTLEGVRFDIPEKGIGYATFELTVTLKINEKLEKPKP